MNANLTTQQQGMQDTPPAVLTPRNGEILPGQHYEAIWPFVAHRLHAQRRPRGPRGFFESLAAVLEPAYDPLIEFTPGNGDFGPFKVLKVEGERVVAELERNPAVQFQTSVTMVRKCCELVPDFMGRVAERAIRVRVAS